MSTYHIIDSGLYTKQIKAIHKLAKIRGHTHGPAESASYVFGPRGYVYEAHTRKSRYFYDDAWEVLPTSIELTEEDVIEAITMFFGQDLGSKKLGADLIFSSDPQKYKDIQYFIEFVISHRKCEFYSSMRDLFTLTIGQKAFMINYDVLEIKLTSAPLMFTEYLCNYVLTIPETTLSIMNNFQEITLPNSIKCKIQFS
jgi:hypothetical protein